MTLSLTDRALEKVQSGGSAPRHRLEVGREDWTDFAQSARVDYTGEGGGSELTFVSRESLLGYEDARVTLWLGYGRDLVPWFAGKLKKVPKGGFLDRSAKALGPFSEMANQSFGEEVSYRGVSAEYALYDIARRARYPRGTIEVKGGKGQLVEQVVFAEEVTLQEGAKAVMDSTGFVGGDAPGSVYGRRLFMPRPRPGATGKAAATYSPDDYAPGGFRPTEKHDSSYARVVVFRRAEDGSYAVRAEAPVEPQGRYKPPANRVYYIPDFLGSAKQAAQTAYDTARSLGAGEIGFELDLLSINPELSMYEQVRVERLDERPGGAYRETYQCRIDEAAGVDVAAWTMALSGSGILLSERKVAAARVVVPRLSAGVVPIPAPPRQTPAFARWGQDDLYLHEITKTYGELS